MNEFYELIEKIIELFESADGAFESIEAVISGIVLVFETLISVFGVLGIVLTAVGALIYFLANYLLEAIPVFVVGKRAGCKLAWLAWIPFFQNFLCLFVLSKTSGKEEFRFLNGKLKIKQGNLVMLGYVLIYFFGSTIVTALIGMLNFIPAIGQVAGLFATLLYILPNFLMAVVEYVYLRDTINVFKPDEKTNQTHAFIIVVLDTLITFGWARTVYLITMMRLKPLPKIDYGAQQQAQYNFNWQNPQC